MSELEESIHYVKSSVVLYRRHIFWVVLTGLVLWIAVEIKEVSFLLLLSYFVSLLLDPLITRLERYRLSRGFSVLLFGFLLITFVAALLVVGVPVLLREYQRLVFVLPTYLAHASDRFGDPLFRYFGISVPVSREEWLATAQEYLSYAQPAYLSKGWEALLATVLSGYSLTMTVVNLTLFPFFVYYIVSDLPAFHRTAIRLLPSEVKPKVLEVCREILVNIHAFVRGQITVSIIMTICYIVGLLVVGLPYGPVVGVLAGLLNVVPYLGITVGLALSTIIALFTWADFWHLGAVWLVFGAVQFLEGSYLTPKIVGESVGIHPLGAMLALIIGAQLLGLLGLIIAIPAAAAVGVLVRHIQREL